ncbi:MAG: NADH-quinone oxidoreductase subunit M, partial [Phycisphaeraceae bacterium JB051]
MYESLLNWLIFTPCIGAVACLLLPADKAKNIALGTTVVALLMTVSLALAFETGMQGPQFVTTLDWIPAINVQYKIGLDGLSLPLVVLTSALSVLVVGAGWKIGKSPNVFMALYLFLMSGMYGVFCSLDMVLFYVFFEISLLPMYFLIGIWGGPRK